MAVLQCRFNIEDFFLGQIAVLHTHYTLLVRVNPCVYIYLFFSDACLLFISFSHIINFKMNTIDKSGLVEFQQRKIYNCCGLREVKKKKKKKKLIKRSRKCATHIIIWYAVGIIVNKMHSSKMK